MEQSALFSHRRVVRSVHPAARRGRGRWLFLLRDLRDQRLGRQQQACDAGGVLHRRSHDFRRVDHACGDQVFVALRLRVEPEGALPLLDPLHDQTSSMPAFSAIWRIGPSRARETISTPIF